jgi:hypothetical protein
MLEGLENRRLLSSSLNAATGELLVVGTAGNDTIRLATAGKSVVVSDNGKTSSFDGPPLRTGVAIRYCQGRPMTSPSTCPGIA